MLNLRAMQEEAVVQVLGYSILKKNWLTPVSRLILVIYEKVIKF
jgi:hypothetical protein